MVDYGKSKDLPKTERVLDQLRAQGIYLHAKVDCLNQPVLVLHVEGPQCLRLSSEQVSALIEEILSEMITVEDRYHAGN